MFASIGSRRTALAILIFEITASAAAAQAKIEHIIGSPTGATVQRAGDSQGVPAAVDSVLQPGDMLRTDSTTKVELRCTTPGAPIYRVAGGFRGYIDVPVNNRCTVGRRRGTRRRHCRGYHQHYRRDDRAGVEGNPIRGRCNA